MKGLCDLKESDALGLFMEFEAVGTQIEAALSHLQAAQENLLDVLLKEMKASTEGKDFPKRPLSDHNMRSYASGMLTSTIVQASTLLQVVGEIQQSCAEIAPHCSVPTTVN
jgi:hypothetical protein